MKRNTKSELEFLYSRLDEVRMSERERMRAKAHLARAEAVADFLVAGAQAVSRLFSKLVIRPILRVAASVG